MVEMRAAQRNRVQEMRTALVRWMYDPANGGVVNASGQSWVENLAGWSRRQKTRQPWQWLGRATHSLDNSITKGCIISRGAPILHPQTPFSRAYPPFAAPNIVPLQT